MFGNPCESEATMITALVQFKLPEPVTPEKAKEIFLSTAPDTGTFKGLFASIISSPRMGKLPGAYICGNLVKTLKNSTQTTGRDLS